MGVNGTLVEDKMRRFKGECAHLSFNKCPIYTHGSASAKFSTNSHETDNSVGPLQLNFMNEASLAAPSGADGSVNHLQLSKCCTVHSFTIQSALDQAG